MADTLPPAGTPDILPAGAPAEIAPLVLLAEQAGSLSGGVISAGLEGGELVVHARSEGLVALMSGLRDDPRYACEQLMDLCGVDWPDRTPRFEVVYNLLSVSRNHRVRVVVRTAEQDAVPSVHLIWPVATWFEREAWDLYGIRFAGQPDLRRILTDYGFEGHPLRKDFPLTGHVEVRYDEERKQVSYAPVSLTQDLRQFDTLSPWEGMMTLPGDEKVHVERKARLAAEAPARALPPIKGTP